MTDLLNKCDFHGNTQAVSATAVTPSVTGRGLGRPGCQAGRGRTLNRAALCSGSCHLREARPEAEASVAVTGDSCVAFERIG